MEAQPALTWPERVVEQYPHATVDLYLPLVVDPWHTEHNHAVRFNEPLKDPGPLSDN